jgi:hypothetical protein
MLTFFEKPNPGSNQMLSAATPASNACARSTRKFFTSPTISS